MKPRKNQPDVGDPEDAALSDRPEDGLSTVTMFPPVIRIAAAAVDDAVASVPMNELIRVHVDDDSVSRSRARGPTRTAAISPTAGEVEIATLVEITAVTLTIAPTDRSKTPARMQIVSPIASSPSGPTGRGCSRGCRW